MPAQREPGSASESDSEFAVGPGAAESSMSPSQPANRDSRDCESTLTRTPGLRVDVPNQSISRNPGRGLSRDPGPDTLRVRVRVRHCVPVTRPRPPSRSDRDSHSDRLRLLLVLEVRIHVTRPGLAGKRPGNHHQRVIGLEVQRRPPARGPGPGRWQPEPEPAGVGVIMIRVIMMIMAVQS